jgi:hypothetical protein
VSWTIEGLRELSLKEKKADQGQCSSMKLTVEKINETPTAGGGCERKAAIARQSNGQHHLTISGDAETTRITPRPYE